jgi:NADPH-dependent ferric siderophore reductase
VDFVVHGDQGIAAPWAAHAQPGDLLTLSGYWAAGRTEDMFQSEKRQPIGQI